jgi:glycosyltransferase involved in cell wall biosynthesis
VSFVIPCYNYGRFLPDCLNSILQLEGGYSFEIVAIDDASTDDTAKVLEDYRDPRLRVLRHATNRGHVQTIADGLLAARGELVARIDPDDRYRSGFLRETVPLFEKYPEVGLIHGDAAMIDGAGNLMGNAVDVWHGGKAAKGNVFVALLQENTVIAATVIARRQMWLDALPLPPGLAFNDWYFNLMIARRTEFYYIPRILAEYRIHGQNHHLQILRNKGMETSITWILHRLFSETEASPELEAAKQSARNRIYGAQFWSLANGYFESDFYADARRCYLKVLRHQPGAARSGALQRRLVGTLLGKRTYNLLRRMAGKPAPKSL